MTLSALLQRTAARYEAAKQDVLKEWQPECGCDRLGTEAGCEACPSLAVFEKLVREKISPVLVLPTQASGTDIKSGKTKQEEPVSQYHGATK